MNLDNILNNKLDKDFLVQLFQEQKEVHAAAIKISLTDEQPQAWRATWILSNCTTKNDVRIQPYVSEYIKAIPNRKDGHQREALKILDKMKLNDDQEGSLFDICMNLWETLSKAPAVRYMAFKHVFKTCQKHPELNGELEFICQEQYLETLSPGIKKIIIKMINT